MTEKLPATLKGRKDFLRLRNGAKWVTPNFILQSGRQVETGIAGLRFGYTASKKVGNAVARNRAKRRMRALVCLCWQDLALPGHDYVMIARPAILRAPFPALQKDMEKALRHVHKKRRKKPRRQ